MGSSFNLYIFSYFFQNGDSPLHIAAAMGRRKLVRILLESPLIDMELKNQQNEGKENTYLSKRNLCTCRLFYFRSAHFFQHLTKK